MDRPTNANIESPPSPEKLNLEKYKVEKQNFIGLKNLKVFLNRTKKQGVGFQKQILKDVFNIKK